MTVTDIIQSSKKPYPSLEIVPPLHSITKQELLDSVGQFMLFEPKYINVTCHRDEYEFRELPDGTFRKHLVRNRVSHVAVCGSITAKYPVEVVPHVICGGQTADEIINELNDFRYLGIDNIMALRGDSLISEKRFVPSKGGYGYASELVTAVKQFNNEYDTQFCIGVGAYPEKHFEAANLETDIAMLKKKVDAGADYVITQMFFDNEVFYRFERKCREAGITVPIIPGLKPLSTIRQLTLLPESFSIDLPLELTTQINEATQGRDVSDSKVKEAVYQIGIEWCIAQCKDLLKHEVPAVHFYTMGKPRNIVQVLRTCF